MTPESEARIGENYLQALQEQFDEGGVISRTTVGCLLKDLTHARAQVVQLQGQLEAARRDELRELVEAASAWASREKAVKDMPLTEWLDTWRPVEERLMKAVEGLAETGAGEGGDDAD